MLVSSGHCQRFATDSLTKVVTESEERVRLAWREVYLLSNTSAKGASGWIEGEVEQLKAPFLIHGPLRLAHTRVA
jgi:hypothetical protein